MDRKLGILSFSEEKGYEEAAEESPPPDDDGEDIV